MKSVASIGKVIGLALAGLFFTVSMAAAQQTGTVNLPEGIDQTVLQIGGVDTAVSDGDSINVDDSIGTQTYDIVVTLSDGSQITATAGSVFTFEVVNGVPTVTVTSGTVSVASNNPDFTVVAGDQRMSGTSLVASVDGSGSGTITPGETTAAIAGGTTTPTPGQITISQIEVVENSLQDTDDASPEE